MAIEKGWAIKNTRRQSEMFYSLIPWRTKHLAIFSFMDTHAGTWNNWYRKGYRAVRVLITDELWRGDVTPERAGARLCCICKTTRFMSDSYDDHGAEDTCESCAGKIERGEI